MAHHASPWPGEEGGKIDDVAEVEGASEEQCQTGEPIEAVFSLQPKLQGAPVNCCKERVPARDEAACVLRENLIERDTLEVFTLNSHLGRCSEEVERTARAKLGPGEVREIAVEGLELESPGTSEISSEDLSLKAWSFDQQEDAAALANTWEKILITGD